MIVTWYHNRLDRWGWRVSLTLWVLLALAWIWLEVSG